MILSIDQGTTNTKAVMVDEAGQIAGRGAASVGLSSPRPGWVEQDADEIWSSVLAAIAACRAAGADPALAGVTIANGADNIAVYTPVFRTVGATGSAVTVAVFAVLVAVWCLAASWLGAHHRVVAVVERWGHWLVPAVFLVIGALIVGESGVLTRIL